MAIRCVPFASLFLCLSFAACTATTTPGWRSEVLLDTGVKLGGCAIGDLDPDVEGPEIAAVAQNGDVWVLTRRGRSWSGERIATLPGEMIQCAIGDADSTHPGDELAVVGMAEGTEESGGRGAAHVFLRTADGWAQEQVFTDDALVHGVDCDGGAVYATGFSRKGVRIVRVDEGWRSEVIAELPGAGKAAVATQFGIAFACTDGSVVISRPVGGIWETVTADERSEGRSRLGTDGARLLVADDDGTLSLIARGTVDVVYHGTAKLRGAVLAELDARGEGLEVATAGYDHDVVVIRRIDGTWDPFVVYEDQARLHHLAAGNLDARPGDELVTCGYSGKIVLLRRVE